VRLARRDRDGGRESAYLPGLIHLTPLDGYQTQPNSRSTLPYLQRLNPLGQWTYVIEFRGLSLGGDILQKEFITTRPIILAVNIS
jgi:hypothetical protein